MSSSTVRGEHREALSYDAISGEAINKELVDAARKVEMETLKKHGVYEKVPIEECWKSVGKALVGVKWVDTSMGDKENPEYRCRLVAKEIKRETNGGIRSRHRRHWRQIRRCSHSGRVCRG